MDEVISNQLSALMEQTLKQILPTNGYFTSLGESVHRGFYAHVFDTNRTKFPAIAIHPPVEDISGTQGGKKVTAAIESQTTLIVAALIEKENNAYDQVKACVRDIRRALFLAREEFKQIASRDELQIGVAEPDLSRDSRVVMYAMTASVKYSETYE
ncbi:MAG: hypothetical protein AAF662_02300 [Pseudomonadota bacterium]